MTPDISISCTNLGDAQMVGVVAIGDSTTGFLCEQIEDGRWKASLGTGDLMVSAEFDAETRNIVLINVMRLLPDYMTKVHQWNIDRREKAKEAAERVLGGIFSGANQETETETPTVQ